jgi:single-strand DNA-binding protein
MVLEVQMFNEAHISLTGYVATQPALTHTRNGIPKMTMRVGWTPRRIDRDTGEWKDDPSSFLSVRCYRKMAENAANCLRKGDPVVVHGRLSVRDYEDNNGVKRKAVEVDANSVGHDLNRGIATFHRVRPQTGMTAMEYKAAEEGVSAGQDNEADAEFADSAAGMPEDGQPGGEMLDETAVSALADEVTAAATPF